MRLGLSTAAFYGRWETEEAAEKMAGMPIDCAEVFLQSQSEYQEEFALMTRRNLGKISCTSVHPLGNHENYMASRPWRQKRDAFDTFRRVLDAGAHLGAKTYVYHGRNTPQLSPVPWNLEWNLEALLPMCEEAKQRDMVIGWENVFWCQLTTPERVRQAAAAFEPVRFTLDIKQAMRAGCDPIEFVYAMGKRLVNVHVVDWEKSGRLCLPGEGSFDFDALFAALKKIEYDGPVILEPYLALIKSDEALDASLAFLRNKIKKIRSDMK